MFAEFGNLIFGLFLFLLIHLGGGVYEVRTFLIDKLGMIAFRVVHSLLSLISLYYIVIGFADRPFVDVYYPFSWGHLVPVFVMPFAFILIVGFRFHQIQRISRHAVLVGIFLFSLSHLFANGDLGSLLLFGTFLIYTPISMISWDRRLRLNDPEGWELFRSRTSIIPFKAIYEGRAMKNRGGAGRLAVWIGLLLYFGLAFAHPYFTGFEIPFFML